MSGSQIERGICPLSAIAADGRIHHLSSIGILNIDGVGLIRIEDQAGIDVLVIRGFRITSR